MNGISFDLGKLLLIGLRFVFVEGGGKGGVDMRSRFRWEILGKQ